MRGPGPWKVASARGAAGQPSLRGFRLALDVTSTSTVILMSIHIDGDHDISAVARMTGVTSRTLRHYDHIGLLTPAWTTPDGRRHYGDEELVRLQHILVLRSLGTSLERIQRIVATESNDEAIALMREHLAALRREHDRYGRLVATVSHTITMLEEGGNMSTQELFDGFDHAQYEPEARERWGDNAVETSQAAWKSLGPDGRDAHHREHEAIATGIAEHAAKGASPDDAAVQDIVARHYRWTTTFWTPDAAAYLGLGQMYVDDDRFKATYDAFGAGTAELLRDAIAVYAAEHLE